MSKRQHSKTCIPNHNQSIIAHKKHLQSNLVPRSPFFLFFLLLGHVTKCGSIIHPAPVSSSQKVHCCSPIKSQAPAASNCGFSGRQASPPLPTASSQLFNTQHSPVFSQYCGSLGWPTGMNPITPVASQLSAVAKLVLIPAAIPWAAATVMHRPGVCLLAIVQASLQQ